MLSSHWIIELILVSGHAEPAGHTVQEV